MNQLHTGIELEILRQLLAIRLVLRFALRTNLSHQPLGHRADERAADEERLHAHLDQARRRRCRVVRVQRREHEMAGQRSLRRRLGSFLVTNFPDHHHVRIVTQNRAQPALKRHAHRAVHWNLVHSRQIIFRRIFDGDHLDARTDNRIQRGVKRRRLARARGTGDEDDSVRSLDEAAEQRERLLVHAKLRQREEHVRLVEQAHHHAFAVKHWDDAHAHVDLPATHVELDASVLRHATLRDVQARENLHTADDRRLEPVHLRRHRSLLQHAVDAIPDRHLVFVRLDVDVARTFVHRFEDDLVDQLDDARLLRHLQQIFAPLDHAAIRVDIIRAHHLVERIAAQAVVRLDQLVDVLARGKHRLDVQSRHQPDVIKRIQIEGIARRHVERAVRARDGNELLAINHLGRQRAERLRVDGHVLQIRHRDVQLLGHHLQQPSLGQHAQLDDRAIQAQSLRLVQGSRLAELLHREQPLIEQNLSDTHASSASLRHYANTAQANASFDCAATATIQSNMENWNVLDGLPKTRGDA